MNVGGSFKNLVRLVAQNLRESLHAGVDVLHGIEELPIPSGVACADAKLSVQFSAMASERRLKCLGGGYHELRIGPWAVASFGAER